VGTYLKRKSIEEKMLLPANGVLKFERMRAPEYFFHSLNNKIPEIINPR